MDGRRVCEGSEGEKEGEGHMGIRKAEERKGLRGWRQAIRQGRKGFFFYYKYWSFVLATTKCATAKHNPQSHAMCGEACENTTVGTLSSVLRVTKQLLYFLYQTFVAHQSCPLGVSCILPCLKSVLSQDVQQFVYNQLSCRGEIEAFVTSRQRKYQRYGSNAAGALNKYIYE